MYLPSDQLLFFVSVPLKPAVIAPKTLLLEPFTLVRKSPTAPRLYGSVVLSPVRNGCAQSKHWSTHASESVLAPSVTQTMSLPPVLVLSADITVEPSAWSTPKNMRIGFPPRARSSGR